MMRSSATAMKSRLFCGGNMIKKSVSAKLTSGVLELDFIGRFLMRFELVDAKNPSQYTLAGVSKAVKIYIAIYVFGF